MKLLGPGDLCPLCGRPIRTDDPVELMLLSLIAEDIAEHMGDVSDSDTSPGRGQEEENNGHGQGRL